MRVTITRFWTALLLLFLTLPVSACPVCQSATGQEVRAGIFDRSFGYNLLVTLLPFPIFLGIALLIYFGVPRPGTFLRRLSGRRKRARAEEL